LIRRIRTSTATGTSSSTSLDFLNLRDNQVAILSDQFAYIVEDTRASGRKGLVSVKAHAIANRRHGYRYIVGDDVKYWQEKGVLRVIDTDGKECKTDIVRQERLK